jgi:hypothetical protein
MRPTPSVQRAASEYCAGDIRDDTKKMRRNGAEIIAICFVRNFDDASDPFERFSLTEADRGAQHPHRSTFGCTNVRDRPGQLSRRTISGSPRAHRTE